jgi:tetratricopeptide (TPR) repeat protein
VDVEAGMTAIAQGLKGVLNRSLWLYLAAALVFAGFADEKQAAKERAHYLLGIFYNEELKSYRDGVVYFDYLIHHKPDDSKNFFLLGYCYMQMDDYPDALRYFELAIQKAPDNPVYPSYVTYVRDKLAGRSGLLPAPDDNLRIPIEQY